MNNVIKLSFLTVLAVSGLLASSVDEQKARSAHSSFSRDQLDFIERAQELVERLSCDVFIYGPNPPWSQIAYFVKNPQGRMLQVDYCEIIDEAKYPDLSSTKPFPQNWSYLHTVSYAPQVK